MSQMPLEPQPSQEDDRPVRRPEWVAHVLDGEHAVLLHLPSARRVALSPEATAVWELVVAAGRGGAGADDLVVALAPRYDADPEVIGGDVRALLDELVGGGWVEPVEPDPVAEETTPPADKPAGGGA